MLVGENSIGFWQAQAEVRDAIEAALIADAGFSRDDAPEALKLAASTIAQAAVVQQSAFTRIVEAGGPLTSRGRQRRAFAVWQSATDRLERSLRLVGMGRKSKPVNPLDAIREAVRAANERGDGEA